MNATFKVDFDWLTSAIRGLWSEARYTEALFICADGGLEMPDIKDIIVGRKRLADDPEGASGVDAILTDDDWEPNLSRCWLGKYPDPDDAEYFRVIESYGVKTIAEMDRGIRSGLYNLENENYYFEKVKIINNLEKIPDEVYVFLGYPKPERRARTESNPIGMLIDVDEFVKKRLEAESKTKPPKPFQFARIGWMSPKGDLYPCEYMEHLVLMDLLKINGEFDSQWIKITHSIDDKRDLTVFLDRKPTDEQVEALSVWAKFYGVYDDVMLAIMEGDMMADVYAAK